MQENPQLSTRRRATSTPSLTFNVTIGLLAALLGAACSRNDPLPQGQPAPTSLNRTIAPFLKDLPANTTLLGTRFRLQYETQSGIREVEVHFDAQQKLRVRVGSRFFDITEFHTGNLSYAPGDNVSMFDTSMKNVMTDILSNNGLILTADHEDSCRARARIDIDSTAFRRIIRILHEAKGREVSVCDIPVVLSYQGALLSITDHEGYCTLRFEEAPVSEPH